jgi:hypothetical protein
MQFLSWQSPCKNCLQSFVFCIFGWWRSSTDECAYLQLFDAHLPRWKKVHIFVFVS